MADIECFFDCSSPWTYFAFHNLLLMQEELKIDIAWRPILVGGVFNAVNPSVHNSREKPVPAKSAYGKKDQEDWARHLGIRMHYRPTVFPVNSVRAMRGCILLEPDGKLVPGMYAQVTLAAVHADASLTIPGDTLLIRPDGPQVALVDSNGKVHFQKVQLGRDYGNKIEVLSGLAPGQKLVVNPGDTVREGVKVNPKQ